MLRRLEDREVGRHDETALDGTCDPHPVVRPERLRETTGSSAQRVPRPTLEVKKK